ncbi:anaerobic ribonucleoside-triphosphate reductase activating protein [Clostridium botulinum]|uniref:anaerobic ribonucleoside-triphosphate reductase activating protein n=1 Tax=Clostridium botulinum TaxID=1491 RepID=UPI0013FC7B13|nr:anaerobic ribonucleoside-triphosphate reductase activating protein [Clostridium botulinum]MBN1072849.1 anaerobic ribonucleoside-triphosphate reductase activating protein [Clostridium botulinum]NFO04660.1 anaerobic ribonucleoside-triphosphate reductase activating protein [Clostridium botulinum]NFO14459.1 anaerobic ribonucleoside-triphosphate reductase activating protein [Clostridium botulinum]
MDKKIRLSGIAYESLVNGPGIRRVFFSQGCNHNCKGCFNPDTHDFNGGEERNIDELIEDVLCNPMIKGITFSGGDPFERADEFSYMAKIFKENNKNIWCYTGYTFEYINDNLERNKGWKDLINNIDVLVDGKFEEDKKEDGLKFRGSSNQRIIDVKESLKSNKVVIFDI